MLSVAIDDRATLFSPWDSQYMQATGTLLVVTSSVVINKNIPPWDPCLGIFPGEASLTATNIGFWRLIPGIKREQEYCCDRFTSVLACLAVA